MPHTIVKGHAGNGRIVIRRYACPLLVVLFAFAVSACAPLMPLPDKLYGATVLQQASATLDTAAAARSLKRLKDTGANSVAFIPFIRQAVETATELNAGIDVTDLELAAGIRSARRLGLRIIVKPQILVDSSWAGAVDPGSPEGWEAWFQNYNRLLVHYARLAQRERADIFVIGTELNRATAQPHWTRLIVNIRQEFSGHLTYAAHGPEGARRFAYWERLDSIGVTLYPPLVTAARPALDAQLEQTTRELRDLSKRHDLPVLVLEVGLPSARGAEHSPWQRPDPAADAVPDPALQAAVLDAWLEHLDHPWVRGVFVWCWYSDPAGGGAQDVDFTVQNKPAEAMLRCRWGNQC
jgi:hypothetical protein